MEHPARLPSQQEVGELLFSERLEDRHVCAILSPFRFTDPMQADQVIQRLAGARPSRELFANILPAVLLALAEQPDPNAALNHFAKFMESTGNRLGVYRHLQHDPFLLRAMIMVFGYSRFLSGILIRNTHYMNLLYSPECGDPRSRMAVELEHELKVLTDFEHKRSALRRFKAKYMLQAAALDLIHGASLEQVTDWISAIAETALQASYRIARERVASQYGDLPGRRGKFVVIAFGKLGGCELNYSSDIDVMFVHDGQDAACTIGGPKGSLDAAEFFSRIGREIIQCIGDVTPDGYVFRIDLRLRPYGGKGPLANSMQACMKYYENAAGTWERQALIKARPVAGDLEMGAALLRGLQGFIYQKYLSQVDLLEIKGIKARIEFQVFKRGEDETGVKLGRGGIRDIEFLIQFLQLLHGGRIREVRTANTLEAIRALLTRGCLDPGHARILETAYRFLRATEHRLQLYDQLKIHALPSDEQEQEKLAIMMGFRRGGGYSSARESFFQVYHNHRNSVRFLFEKLFFYAYRDTESSGLLELVFDPDMDRRRIAEILDPFGFQDPHRAYHIIQALAAAPRFSQWQQRSRRSFGNLAPDLLRAVAGTPDPDRTINNVEKCLSAFGAKAMFYRLLRENRHAMEMLVRICGMSDYLTEILVNYPEMLDELIDNLGTGVRKDIRMLQGELWRLLAKSRNPIRGLYAFCRSELLRIGMMDILGQRSLGDTTRALAELAEVIFLYTYRMHMGELVKKYGEPRCADGKGIATMAVLAVGKFGGREINYHSDLDVIFVYSQNGRTDKGMHNQEFFARLANAVIRTLGSSGPYGYLYKVDTNLRPGGMQNPVVCTFATLKKYYGGRGAQTWERMAMIKLRPIIGERDLLDRIRQVIEGFVFRSAWHERIIDDMTAMRTRLEASVAGKQNMKRGRGGIVDIEFLVQLLQLKHGMHDASLRIANTALALFALRKRRILKWRSYQTLLNGYEFLRMVENRLRIVSNISKDTLPRHPRDVDLLAKRLGYRTGKKNSAGEVFLQEYRYICHTIRACYEKFISDDLRGS